MYREFIYVKQFKLGKKGHFGDISHILNNYQRIFNNFVLKCAPSLEVHSSATKRARNVLCFRKLIFCCLWVNQSCMRNDFKSRESPA